MGMIPGTTERSGVDKRGRLLIGVVLTAFFLWLALRNVDLRAVREALRSPSYIYLIPAALSSLLGYCVRTARWGRILAPIKKAPFGRLFPVLMAGFAANNLLPARIEELDVAVAKGEALLGDPDLFTRDPKRFDAIMKGIAAARAEKEAAEERWLELAELVESA